MRSQEVRPRNHNEQFPSYCRNFIQKKDYLLFDCIRGPIWHGRKIPVLVPTE
jgi:hypothetical protein